MIKSHVRSRVLLIVSALPFTLLGAGGCASGDTSVPRPTQITAVPTTPPGNPDSSSSPSLPSTSPDGTGTAPTESGPVATESAPPGDIPDNLAFIRYRNAAGHYSFTHPEGWAEQVTGAQASFVDKLNSVTLTSSAARLAPTVRTVQVDVVPQLAATTPAFELRGSSAAKLPGGQAVRVVFRRDSAADPVTGRVYRLEVEDYLVFRSGRLVSMQLSGPVGADNVDAYRTMSESLVIQ